MKMNNMNLSIINSPWPMMNSINLMNMAMNILMKMNNKILLMMLLMMMMNTMSIMMWIKNSIAEKMMIGMTSNYNEMSMKTMIWFIIMTETMFFSTFFYVNFSMSLFNNIMFNLKYNLNMFKLNFILSFTNLMILLSSSMTLMIATFMNEKSKNKSMIYINVTMTMGTYFMMIQMLEYSMLNFNMSNSIFFSNFFMLTMFHMSHVMMGTMMMMVIMNNKKKMLMSNKSKMKMMCWYWHFVDMIWVMIFVTLYTK